MRKRIDNLKNVTPIGMNSFGKSKTMGSSRFLTSCEVLWYMCRVIVCFAIMKARFSRAAINTGSAKRHDGGLYGEGNDEMMAADVYG